MRILFATSIKTWGGGEEWMLSHARALAARGHDVSLAARPGSPILARAEEVGLPLLPAAFRSDADLASFLRVLRHCRHRRIEAVCLNMDRVLRVAGPAARLAGVPVVLPRRGSEFPLKDGPVYRYTYRRVATGMIVNSRATERTLCRDIPWRPAGRVHVLPNGVDLSRFDGGRSRAAVRAELGLPGDVPLLAAVGELTERKNLALLLDVAPGLVRRFPGLTILVIGDGVEREPLRVLARSRGLANAVRFLGFRRDVPDLLRASDVLVHPSRVEGFGYVLVEAMAAGLPVVATDASSIPEIVRDGATGTLFAGSDGPALERAVAAYLEDPCLRARHGRAGRERVEREYSFDRRLEEFEGILRNELARSLRKEGP